jgi:hypothetical protein
MWSQATNVEEAHMMMKLYTLFGGTLKVVQPLKAGMRRDEFIVR